MIWLVCEQRGGEAPARAMAVDVVATCEQAFEQMGSNTFLVGLVVVFSVYILADTFIAAAVVRTKVVLG